MSKKSIRLLAVLLILAMTLTLVPTAFAEETVKVSKRQYGAEENGGVLILGDSVARGCGATPGNNTLTGKSDYYDIDGRFVENSFPTLLCDALGCTYPGEEEVTDDIWGTRSIVRNDARGTFWPICFPGQSLSSTMDLLGIEDGFTDIYEGTYNYYAPDMKRLYGSDARRLMDTASLIVINLGLNDVFLRSISIALYAGGDGGIGEDVDAESLASAETLGIIGQYMVEGFSYWTQAYPLLLQYIKRENPKATVVLVSNFDVLANSGILEEEILPSGTAIGSISLLMNQYIKQWAAQYGCLYADITNVETPASQNGWAVSSENFSRDFEQLMISVHPTPEGHRYIYRQILNVLPEANAADPVEEDPVVSPCPIVSNIVNKFTGETDIVFDTGRFEARNIAYVMVNRKIVKNFSFDNSGNPYEITIPYGKRDGSLLTIVAKENNGKLAVYTYQLVYNQGYTVYRIASTNDAVGTAVTNATKIYNIGSSILGSIVSLFKK